MNVVNCIGNLTRDPELKYTQGGVAIAELGVAINNRIKRGEEWVDEPCFIDVTTFGKRAEWLANNLMKGEKVGITGSLQMDQWEDRSTGQKRTKIRIKANEVTLCGKSRSNSNEAASNAGAPSRSGSSPPSPQMRGTDDPQGEYSPF